jgi:hypothetical protein
MWNVPSNFGLFAEGSANCNGCRTSRPTFQRGVKLVHKYPLPVDQTDSYRNHRLGFLRLSVAKSRSRIEALGIKSEQVDRFVDALWFNSEIEFRFRRKRFRSVELTIEALDLLSQTAARYGRRGRKVFVVNQEPIVNAIRLIECLPLEEAEEVLVEPLTRWLEHPPEFDPEGWALPLFGEF